MALGLGKMCGISLEENFDNPYLANSISSFWRKWHISLSNFFKEYVYFPLGGSKKNKLITIRNLVVVWLLTGIWHGNTINFLLWGLYYGIIIVLEKFVLNNFLEKLPKIFKHLYVIIIVLFGYILFTQNSLNDIENKLNYARTSYNDAVTSYNNLVESVPSNIIAKMFSFKRKELFKIDEEKRNNVKVNFND